MTNLFNSFAVSVKEKDNNINGSLVDYDDLKIRHLKYLICLEKSINIGDHNGLNLWKVASGCVIECFVIKVRYIQ